jgi:hypothetical protein
MARLPEIACENPTMSVSRNVFEWRRRIDAAEQRLVNVEKKSKERARRDARMMLKVRRGKFPFTPAVMSWLSTRLEKPSSRISANDLKQLTA